MLIDDEAPYTELMSQMIVASLDCDVAAFTSPQKALDALPAIRPAVVVTDYNMPEINGLDLIHRVQSDLPSTVFVLITGHDLTSHDLSHVKGLKSVLTKPCSWRTLSDEILRVWPDEFPKPAQRLS